MKKIVEFPDRRGLEEEAAFWLVKLDGGEMSEDEKRRLRRWLARSRHHREAIQDLAQLWDEMDCLQLLAQLVPEGGGVDVAPEPVRARFGRLPRGLTLACAIAASAVIAVVLALPATMQWLSAGSPPSELVYETRKGEQSLVKLRDGSTLSLNTNSQVRVRFNDHERSVYLARGEVFAKVAHNPHIPFVVHAGRGKLRAIGTAFNVMLNNGSVDVLVAEGAVEVSLTEEHYASPSQEQPSSLILEKAAAARYTHQIELQDVLSQQRIERKLAWRNGKWAFEGETLAEVIAEVGRYTDTDIRIIDSDIADLRIGGYFDIGDIDLLLQALETGFGVEVRRMSDNLIYLTGIRS